MTLNDQILFAKRLAILLKAEVPITDALGMMRDQSNNKANNQLLNKLIIDLQNGLPLSAGLARHKKLLGLFGINIIKIGEAGGSLGENLEYLSGELKKRQELKSKVVSAFIYPGIIVAATLGITGLLTLYVFPKILPVFQSFNFTLPFATRFLIGLTNFATHKLWVVLTGAGLSILLFIGLMRLPAARVIFDREILRLPFVGKLLQSYFVANICRSLGLLLQSHVHIVDATRITAVTATNLVYRRELHNLAGTLARGEKMSSQLAGQSKLFPPLVNQMASVGEMSGNLSSSFLYLADIYEQEVSDMAKNLSTLIEPVLMVGMGTVVGFVAISIITPIYQITQNIKP